MKNRKQKQIPPKRHHNVLEEMQHSEVSTNNGKNPSSHTKISTNCTIHSTVGLHPTPEKRTRSRKNGKSSTKENTSEAPSIPLRSKSGQKVKKYDLPLDIGVSCFDVGEESCREYCVVE